MSKRICISFATFWIVAAAAHAQEAAAPPGAAEPRARVPLLSDAEAWQRLPKAAQGGEGPLPAWAKALAGSLPRTTAAMLELDWRHRADEGLDEVLRGKIRWTVARANRCRYTAEYARADLKRAGLDDDALRQLDDRDAVAPSAERATLRFARKLTLEGSRVTDDEVAQLKEVYGEAQLVGIVLAVAYANFQDRLVLALGLETEPGGPLAPIKVRFSKLPAAQGAPAPERKPPADRAAVEPAGEITDREWLSASFAELQEKLEAQRRRPTRIRIPTWDEVRALFQPRQIPSRAGREQPLSIRWSLVCLGYQPILGRAWLNCMRTFAEESQQDRVFEESLFWVITRSIDCFY